MNGSNVWQIPHLRTINFCVIATVNSRFQSGEESGIKKIGAQYYCLVHVHPSMSCKCQDVY